MKSREKRYAHGRYRMNSLLTVGPEASQKTFNSSILKNVSINFDKIAPTRSRTYAFRSVKARSKSIGGFSTEVLLKIANFYTDEDIVTNFTWVRRALTAEKNGMHMDLIVQTVASQSTWKRGDLHFCSLNIYSYVYMY